MPPSIGVPAPERMGLRGVPYTCLVLPGVSFQCHKVTPCQPHARPPDPPPAAPAPSTSTAMHSADACRSALTQPPPRRRVTCVAFLAWAAWGFVAACKDAGRGEGVWMESFTYNTTGLAAWRIVSFLYSVVHQVPCSPLPHPPPRHILPGHTQGRVARRSV